MANTQEYITLIKLNDKEAKQGLEELEKKVKNLKEIRDKAISDKNDAKVIRDLNKQVKAAEAEMNAYKTKVLDIHHTINHLGTATAEEVRKAMRALRTEQSKTADPKVYAEIEGKIGDCNKRLVDLKHNQELVNQTMKNLSGVSLKDLESTAKMLNAQLKEVGKGSEEYKKLAEQLKQVKSVIRDINEETKESQSLWSKLTDFATKYWALFTQAAAVTGLTVTMRQAVKQFAQMEEAMANVRKYTGQTAEQVREMNEDLKKIDTRTSREELNELAGAAGRLGKTSKKDIEDFVDAADKIGVALGDDLGQGAVDKIGKLAMAFGEDEKKGLRGAMLATGSAINELAQNSSAQAGYLVEFTARVAGVAKTLGMSQADIMGYGAVLDETMQKDEMAATAFSQLLSKMASDTKTFAKLAGKDAKEFAGLVKNDVNGAVITLMRNIGKQGGFEQMAKMFDDMGLDGSRALSVLTTMADKIQLVQERQFTANKAYSEGTSVIKEFGVQNNTVQAGLDKAKKAFNEIVVELGEKLMPLARYGLTTTSAAIKILATLVKYLSENGEVLVSVAAGVAAYTVAVHANTIAAKTENALIAAGWTLKKGYIITMGVLTGKIRLATVAQHALNLALKANPYIAVATAVATVTYGYLKWIKITTDTKKSTEKLNTELKEINDRYDDQKEKIEKLLPIAQDETKSTEQRKEAIKALKEIYPDYFKNLDIETAKQYELAKVLKAQNAERRKELVLKAQDAADKYNSYAKEYYKNAEADKKMEGANTPGANNGTSTLMRLQEEAKLNDLRNAAEAALKALNDFDAELADDMVIYQPKDTSGAGTSSPYKSDKDAKKEKQAQDKAERERKKKIKDAIDAQKALSDKEQAINMEQYSHGEKTYREYLEKKHQIALDSLDKQMKIYGEDSDEAKRLLDNKAQLEMQYADRIGRLDETDIRRRAQTQAFILQEQFETAGTEIYHDNEALNEALFQNEMDALIARRDLYEKYSEDWMNIEAEITERDQQHSLERKQYYADQLARYREQWARRDIAEEERTTLLGLDRLHAQGLLKEEEYQEMRREIQLRYAQMQAEQNRDNSRNETISRNASTAYQTAKANAQAQLGNSETPSLGSFLMGDINMYKSTMAQLHEMYADVLNKNGELDEQDKERYEEYQQAKSQAFGDFASGIGSKMQAAYDAITPILNGMSSYWSAQSQYEQNVTTKKYDKLIKAAGNNSAKTKKLEEKKQKELAEIKSKYNKRAMKMEIAQATATMILGAMNAYTSAFKGAPYPANLVLAPVAAGIALAAGALNIATIKKQHDAEAAGFYSGGFTGGSQYRREAGVVHEGEFVVNHNAVNNRRLFPALQLIDQAQRNNTVGSLTADDITRSVGGGATVVSAPTVNVQTDNSEVVATMQEAREVIDRLSSQLEQGIHASVTMDGEDGLVRAQRRWERLQGNK